MCDEGVLYKQNACDYPAAVVPQTHSADPTGSFESTEPMTHLAQLNWDHT